jgi:flagellar hook-length control protein FliK
VAKAFQMAQERDGKLHLRLSPPELGSLRLELSVKEGVMTATLEAETTAARKVLLDHLPALRDRLAEQNIRIERFDVDVRRDDGGQADGHSISSIITSPTSRRRGGNRPRSRASARPGRRTP